MMFSILSEMVDTVEIARLVPNTGVRQYTTGTHHLTSSEVPFNNLAKYGRNSILYRLFAANITHM